MSYCKRGNRDCQQIGCDCYVGDVPFRTTPTLGELFNRCGLCLHRHYESFVYWPIGDTSDLHWLRWDANDADETHIGVQMLDGFDWVPVEDCAGISKEEVELLHAQIPNAIPLNALLVKGIEYRLPGFVYDILVGRFRDVADAKSEDNP